MKMTFQKLVLGTVAAIIAGPLVAGTSAEAGDYNGGLKGLRGTHVPVPAPVPIPDHKAKWYLRGDIGVGYGVGLEAGASGSPFGVNDAGSFDAATPFGFEALTNASTNDGHDVAQSIGFGVGHYFSSAWRGDLTVDFRADKEVETTGRFQYDDATPTNNRVFGSVNDHTELKSAVFLANAYYDINRSGRWSPYIGGGVGFAVNEVTRRHRTNLSTCTTTGPGTACTAATSAAGSHVATATRDYSYSFAANLSAGVGYRISDITSLDFNYRYLYVGGTDVSATINGRDSTVNLDDQHEHYLRAGLRFDIN